MNPTCGLTPLNRLLERLENVRVAGKGYRADCPNGHRSRGALAVGESETGSVLLHCHAGCAVIEVIHGAGLEMKDLFPMQDHHRMSPQEQREIRNKARQAGWKTVLEFLPLEIAVLRCANVQMRKGKSLNLADSKRLELAGERINNALMALK